MMKYHHLYEDENGMSHWRDVEIKLREKSFAPPAKHIEISEAEAASALVFLKLRKGWNEPVHPTPLRQTLICLAGVVRVTASDGDSREISCGDIWRMEDLTGEGHNTQVIGEEDFKAAIVQFD